MFPECSQVKTIPTFQNWFKAPTFPKVDAFFPFEWNGDEWRKAFDRIEGKLLVPPILQNFVLNRRGGPQQVISFGPPGPYFHIPVL
jgi:hypothetical protein